jgi:hypothetical protein
MYIYQKTRDKSTKMAGGIKSERFKARPENRRQTTDLSYRMNPCHEKTARGMRVQGLLQIPCNEENLV